MNTCTIPGCKRPVHARGTCSSHYHLARAAAAANGDLLTRVSPDAPIEERIAAHSEPGADGHVLWTGYITRGGVPVLAVEDDGTTRRTLNVRAEMLEQAGSPRPERGRWFARVTCDEPDCIAAEHLEWDNRRADARLDSDTVNMLVNLHKNRLLNVSDAADELGVSRQTIYNSMWATGYDPKTAPGPEVVELKG